MSARRQLLWVIAALVALLVSSAPSQATPLSQARLTMTVRGGYGDGGSYIIGEWFPVHVALSNPAGSPSLRVRVTVESKGQSNTIVSGEYARDVDLPGPSRKEITLYAYAGDFVHSLDVTLLNGDTVLDRESANLNPLEPQSGVVVGVVASDAGLLNVLKGEDIGHIEMPATSAYYGGYLPAQLGSSGHPAATIEHIQLGDIPPVSAALNSLGVLVIDDVDTGALQQEQRDAVAAWVARGGALIFVARPGGADTMVAFPDLAPVTVAGTHSLSSLDGLASLVSVPITPTGAVLAASAALKSGSGSTSRVLASQDGVPLVVQRQVGKGSVVYMAISPGQSPLKGWDGTVALFKRVLAQHPVRSSFGAQWRNTNYYSYYPGNPNTVFDTSGNLFDLPGLDLPDSSLIALFLLVYILIVGPVNFIILRRIGRAELAWLTIPVLIVIFSVGAYLLAFQSKGGQVVAIRANLVNDVPGTQVANVTQFFGLFSPFRHTFGASLNADSAVTEISPYGYGGGPNASSVLVTGGNPTRLADINVNTWSLKAFMAEHTVQARSPLESDLHVGDNIIEGTIRNRTTTALQDVALIRGDALQYVGYIGPGQSADVKLTVSSQPFDSSTAPASFLPTPPGVTPVRPNPNPFPGPGSNTGNISPEQRLYNRKVQFLGSALSPLVSADAPDGLDVLAVAWGPPSPTSFEMDGQGAQSEEINLWTSHLPVIESSADKAKLKPGAVPFTIYAPGNDPSWSIGLPGNSPQRTNPYPQPPPANPRSGQSTSNGGIALDPYADLSFSLPPGTRADSLALTYQVSQFSGQVDALAYNVNKGTWDRLDSLHSSAQGSTISLGSPSDYIDSAGYVSIRLRPTSGTPTLNFSSLGLSLNEAQ